MLKAEKNKLFRLLIIVASCHCLNTVC